MESYKNHRITFNTEFFNSLNDKWLTGIEIYTLLNNAEELIKNNFIKLINSEQYKNEMINESNKNKFFYFLTQYKEYGFLLRENKYEKTRYYNIKIQSIEKIKVINSINQNEQRRIYYLLDNPKYIFIINFNPDYIEEDKENQKLFIIIKSKFNSKDLNNLKPYLSISFGNKFVKYEVISDNVLSCYIPPQKKKEVIIDIYFSNQTNQLLDKISIYEQKNKKSFCYISNKSNEGNNNLNNINTNINKEIDKYKIFNYGIREIISRVISLFNYFLVHINFYNNQEEQINNEINLNTNNNIIMNNINNNIENKIDINLIQNNSKIEGGGFYEINVNFLLEKIIIELKKLNKIELINSCDEDGYNLLHYLSVLNFSKSLILLNNNNRNNGNQG